MRAVAVGVSVSVFMVWAIGRAYDYELATAGGSPVKIGDGTLLDAIAKKRATTWRCQAQIGRARSETAYSARRSPSLAYRKWVHRLWAKRARFNCAAARQVSDPVRAIYAVFGTYGSEAVRVARCESGLSVWARNGQYENLFQMGTWERRTYGWHTVGSSPLAAARAAFNYFRASGYSWRAWSCKP